jgi:phosphoglycolate phosphatase-like HAD superfamily hydrolase
VVRLVLFDIDGTLIRTGGAGVKAFERTFQEEFGLPGAASSLSFAGRTDYSLVREFLSLHGVSPAAEHFARFFGRYTVHLEALLRELPGGVCEGIAPFMDELERVPDRPVMGLLTGNVRRGAELKLSHYDLWRRFEMGAFADDHEDRNCIAAIARQRGEERLGRPLHGDEILVIGDTPLDIQCARSIGARVLAVATGNFTAAQLREHRPTWAVDHAGCLNAAEALNGG